ncbi:hypothetical protein SROCM77S_01134 [Streptomyces rochei]
MPRSFGSAGSPVTTVSGKPLQSSQWIGWPISSAMPRIDIGWSARSASAIGVSSKAPSGRAANTPLLASRRSTSAERVRVRTDPPGELVGGQRTLGERLGHLQFGGDVHRTRDHDTHDQFQQSERRRREFPALPLQIRSCFLRFPYDVRRRQFGHEFPPWQERKSLSQPPEGTGTTTIWKKVDASWRETRIPLVHGCTPLFPAENLTQ